MFGFLLLVPYLTIIYLIELIYYYYYYIFPPILEAIYLPPPPLCFGELIDRD